MKKLDSIMCIDDDEATNFFHKVLFEGLKVTDNHQIFDNPEKALTKLIASEDIPDLILLDINMPKMNGWEFLDEYLKNELDKKLNNTKIVMLTTSSSPSDKSKADQYECVNGFETKILNAEKLNSLIEKHF